jgi:hypothetical protein
MSWTLLGVLGVLGPVYFGGIWSLLMLAEDGVRGPPKGVLGPPLDISGCGVVGPVILKERQKLLTEISTDATDRFDLI